RAELGGRLDARAAGEQRLDARQLSLDAIEADLDTVDARRLPGRRARAALAPGLGQDVQRLAPGAVDLERALGDQPLERLPLLLRRLEIEVAASELASLVDEHA